MMSVYWLDLLVIIRRPFKQPAVVIHSIFEMFYRQTPNISRVVVGNKRVGHSNVVDPSPVSAAPTTFDGT